MNDHEWLATRYVLGELDDLEEAQCEERLASDQSFREAVASAVELLRATRHVFESAPPVVASARKRTSRLWGVGLVSSAAAAIMVGAVILTLRPNESKQIDQSLPAVDAWVSDQITNEEAAEVARHWVDQQAHHREAAASLDVDPFEAANDEALIQPEESYSSDWLGEAAKIDPGS